MSGDPRDHTPECDCHVQYALAEWKAGEALARAEAAEADLAEALAYIAQLEDQDAARAGRRMAGLDLTVEQRRERGRQVKTPRLSQGPLDKSEMDECPTCGCPDECAEGVLDGWREHADIYYACFACRDEWPCPTFALLPEVLP